jgi:hypothetical protein
MTASAITLCNQALRLLGEISITSFDEATELAETCNILYPDFARTLLCAYPWRFTLRKAQLSRLADPPLNEWQHQFAQPADMMLLRHLFTSSAINQPPLREFEIFEARIYANQTALWADYQAEVDASLWPPHVLGLARVALAAELAIPVTGSTSLQQLWQARAYGTPQEAGNGGQMRQARTLDALQQPAQGITDFPLLTARHGRR